MYQQFIEFKAIITIIIFIISIYLSLCFYYK